MTQPHIEFTDGVTSVPAAWFNAVDRGVIPYLTPGHAKKAGSVEGENFVTGESVNGGGHPGGSAETSAGQDWVDLDHDGEFLVMLEQGVVSTTEARVVVRDLAGGTALRTHLLGQFADYSAIACNGEYIAVARADGSGTVTVIDYDGTVLFTATHGAEVRDIFIDAERVVVVGENDGANVYARSWTLAGPGTAEWTLTRDAASGPLWSVTGDDDYIYVAGESDASTSDDLYRLVNSTGAIDASASIGTLTQEVYGSGRLVVGEHSLFMATTSASPGNLYIYEVAKQGPLTTIDTLNLSAESGGNTWSGNLAIDDRHLYVGGQLTYNYAIPVYTGDFSKAWPRARRVGPSNTVGRVVTTGQYLHSITRAAPTSIANIGVGRRPGVWHYREIGGWFRRKFVPSQ